MVVGDREVSAENSPVVMNKGGDVAAVLGGTMYLI
jgi:high-affinity K+ transport system ATPase subunit B